MSNSGDKRQLLKKSNPDPLAYLKIITDSDGHAIDAVILNVNTSFEKMIDLAKDQIVGRNVTAAPKEIKDLGLDWIYHYQQMIEKREPRYFEYYAKPLQRWNQVLIFSDTERFFYTLFREEAAIKRERGEIGPIFSFQEKVVDPSMIWISTFDRERNVVLWNKGAQKLSGFTAKEAVGSSKIWGQLYPDTEHCSTILETYQDVITKGKKIENIETEIHKKEGLKRNVNWCFQPIEAQESIVGCLVLGVDTQKRENQKSYRGSSTKKETILLQEEEIKKLSLAHIIDVEKTQSLMDDFYQLTHFGVALVDHKGKVLVKTGWQDICTKFHRIHPETRNYCIESDTKLTENIRKKAFKLYKCKNNMWDIATPIIVGQRHMGNLFLGQFFFNDEKIDYEVFKAQAKKYSFNQEAYIQALDRVPRWSRETVYKVMEFYTKLAHLISLLSYSNSQLKQLITKHETTIQQLKEAEKKLALYSQKTEDLYLHQQKQMEKARHIHEQIMPKEMPKIEEVSFCAYYMPAEKLGGDFYDIIQINNKIILYLSDVSGHGLDGALLSVFIKHTIKGFFSFASPSNITPANILKYLSDKFREENYPDEYFICIFLAVLDLKTMKVHYAGAGFQDFPLVLLGNGKRTELKTRGLFITTLLSDEELVFNEYSLSINPGTTILFNTDGLTEEGTSENFYRDKLPLVFYENAHLSPSDITHAITKDFQQFNNGSMHGSDDITFLVIKIHPKKEEKVEKIT